MTLAEHHVHCFASWNMKTQNQKLASQSFQACQIGALLENTASLVKTQFDLHSERRDESDLGTPENSSIGRGVICRNAPVQWLKFAGREGFPSSEHFAWFGYAWQCVQVGFYCEGGAVKNAIRILRKIGKSGEEVSNTDDGGYVWINKPADDGNGDQEWIVDVFNRLSREVR